MRWAALGAVVVAATVLAEPPRRPPRFEDTIPPPPSAVRPGGIEARKAWFAKLTRAQQRYVTRHCSKEENAYDSICGGTPLVAVFDGRPVEYRHGSVMDWPSVRTPWLARDLDGDGQVAAGAELFGSDTKLPDGSLARDGFQALAALDANHDGVLDARDPAFATLYLWYDHDGDRKSGPGELVLLSSVIDSVTLKVTESVRCSTRVDCERLRAPMTWHSGHQARSGEVVDVFLQTRISELASAL